MYSVDDGDTVQLLSGVPRIEPGAPIPVIVADEWHVLLAYIIRQPFPPDWDGSTVKEMTHKTQGEAIAQVEFVRPWAHMSGPPNDEAFDGHPLAHRGLEPYGTFEVKNSSWLRSLVTMNSVHPRHDPSRFADDHHFVFAFHDSTFEVIAREFQVSLHVGSMSSAIEAMTRKLAE